MNKESLYFITSLRSDLVNELNESLTENDKNYVIENFSDGDILSLSLIGKTIPENENKQSYVEGLLHAFNEEFFEGNLHLEIDAENNSYSILKENLQEVSREDDFFPDENEPTPRKKPVPNKSDMGKVGDQIAKQKPSMTRKGSGFDDPHPMKNTKIHHTASGFDDSVPHKHSPNVRVHKQKSDMGDVGNEIAKQNTGEAQSSFQNAVKHFKDFFMNNHGQNLKIGLGVAAASAAAYGAYKLYKAKFGDTAKAKNAQVAQLNKAKSMAGKTSDPNKYKQMLQDKINKIKSSFHK